MKKIFTLLFATVMLGTAFAQYGQKGQRGQNNEDDVYVSNNDHGYDRDFRGAYVFTPRERDMQIARINRNFDMKIHAVKNKPYMGMFQKNRLIRNLEVQRDSEIQQVIHTFRSPKNKFGDQVRRDKKRW
jgi:hypothetical protein